MENISTRKMYDPETGRTANVPDSEIKNATKLGLQFMQTMKSSEEGDDSVYHVPMGKVAQAESHGLSKTKPQWLIDAEGAIEQRKSEEGILDKLTDFYLPKRDPETGQIIVDQPIDMLQKAAVTAAGMVGAPLAAAGSLKGASVMAAPAARAWSKMRAPAKELARLKDVVKAAETQKAKALDVVKALKPLQPEIKTIAEAAKTIRDPMSPAKTLAETLTKQAALAGPRARDAARAAQKASDLLAKTRVQQAAAKRAADVGKASFVGKGAKWLGGGSLVGDTALDYFGVDWTPGVIRSLLSGE